MLWGSPPVLQQNWSLRNEQWPRSKRVRLLHALDQPSLARSLDLLTDKMQFSYKTAFRAGQILRTQTVTSRGISVKTPVM